MGWVGWVGVVGADGGEEGVYVCFEGGSGALWCRSSDRGVGRWSRRFGCRLGGGLWGVSRLRREERAFWMGECWKWIVEWSEWGPVRIMMIREPAGVRSMKPCKQLRFCERHARVCFEDTLDIHDPKCSERPNPQSWRTNLVMLVKGTHEVLEPDLPTRIRHKVLCRTALTKQVFHLQE